jgi:hypothetical protein
MSTMQTYVLSRQICFPRGLLRVIPGSRTLNALCGNCAMRPNFIKLSNIVAFAGSFRLTSTRILPFSSGVCVAGNRCCGFQGLAQHLSYQTVPSFSWQ